MVFNGIDPAHRDLSFDAVLDQGIGVAGIRSDRAGSAHRLDYPGKRRAVQVDGSRMTARARGCLLSLSAMLLLLLVMPGTLFGQTPPTVQKSASPAPAAISSTVPVPDSALRQRIGEIFDNLDVLEGVSVDVRSGVVFLSGEVAETADRENAVEISKRIEGVVEVQNAIAVSRNFRMSGFAIYERLQTRLTDIVATIPLFLIAVAIFIVFVVASRLIVRKGGFVERLTRNPFLQQILTQTGRAAIIVVGLILALEVLNATSLIGAVLGAAGLGGIVLGFALKETIENYVSGLLLSLRQPFAPNDHVLVMGYEGHVIRLTARATVLMTLDGNHVRVPNADVFKSPLVNYTRNPERRFDFEVGIGVGVDITAARILAIETLQAMPGVLDKPSPDSWVETLGDSNVVLRILGWIDQRQHSLPKVRGEAIRRVKNAFEAAKFDLPEPIYRLNIMDVDDAYRGVAEQPFRRSAPAPEKSGAVPYPEEPAPDIARDTDLEQEIAAERAETPGTDLLDPEAMRE